MKKNIILQIAIIFLVTNSYSQNLDWTQKFGVSGNDNCNAMVVDAFGNRYSTGWLSGQVDFDPSPVNSYYLPTPPNNYFLQKTTSSGDFIWVNGPQSGQTVGRAIDVNNSGEIYVAGLYYGTVDFDTTSAAVSLTGSTSSENIFIAKYGTAGNLLWVKGINAGGSFLTTETLAMDVHSQSGKLTLTGNFRGTMDSDPGVTTNILSSVGNGYSTFVIQLNNNGDLEWSFSQAPSTSINYHIFGYDATEYNGNTYIVGTHTAEFDCDPSAGVTLLTPVPNTYDGFIEKFDGNGNLIWAKAIGGGNSYILIYNSEVDALGNLYVVGAYSGTADFDPGPATVYISTSATVNTHPFVLKLDASGNFLWVKDFQAFTGNQNLANKIGINSDGNINVAGVFQNSGDFDPGNGTFNITSAGGKDAFLVELTSAGNFVWAGAIQSAGNDNIRSLAFDINPGGDLYISGDLTGTVDVNPNPAVYNLTGLNSSLDMFISKISCRSPIHINQLACQSYTWAENNQTYTTSGD